MLPPAECLVVFGMKAPCTPAQLIEALECAITILKIAKPEHPKVFPKAKRPP